ncbi:MAG: von Willebrand factor type A domain-containing protein [Myxococcota bacterium]
MRRVLPVLSSVMVAACAAAPVSEPRALPDRGYAAFAHYGTNPVVDTEEEPEVRVGVAADRASWTLVHHYMDRGRLPPPEAVRVEDCVAAMAPPAASSAGASAMAVATRMAPSPFRAGWSVLVVTIAAPRDADRAADDVVVVSEEPDGAFERAMAARGARVFAGDASALGAALIEGERAVLSDGAGLGGPDAQARCWPGWRARASAARSCVGGRTRAARLRRRAARSVTAQVGGGIYDVPLDDPARPATRRARPSAWRDHSGLSDVVATLRFDARRVTRWPVGYESRSTGAAASGAAASPSRPALGRDHPERRERRPRRRGEARARRVETPATQVRARVAARTASSTCARARPPTRAIAPSWPSPPSPRSCAAASG